MTDDAQIFLSYQADRSPAAFARVVRRYIDLVYSAARRQVRDEYLAHDITQAVFIYLSQKAAAIHNPQALPAWLLKTTHHVSCNALRQQRRRANHEKEAAKMKSLVIGPEQATVSQKVAPVLDEALARLRERDRFAIVLRFLEGKSIVDVGIAMGISQAAAEKRVTRAIARLRNGFARLGIHTAQEAMGESLSGQVLLSAPAALIARTSASELTNSAGASSLVNAVAKAEFWLQVKAAILGCAAMVVIAGGVVIVASGAPSTSPAASGQRTEAPASSQPAIARADDGVQKFPNVVFFNNTNYGNYFAGLDPDTLGTKTGSPAGYIKSIVPKNKLAQGAGQQGGQRGFAAGIASIRGKRIRLTAWIKTRNMDNWCGLELYIMGQEQRVLSEDDMGDRPVFGTTDWKQYSLVADVPPEAQSVMFDAQMRGTGEMWSDDFEIETVGNDVPTTDDQHWRLWSPAAPKTSVILDPANPRDGHPTLRVTNTSQVWSCYDHHDRNPEAYLGKRVRISAWLKADRVSVVSGLWIKAYGPNFQKISEEGNWGTWATAKPIKGTVGWTHFACELDVPLQTQCIVSGMIHNGSGTIWMDDFKFEVVGDAEGK